MSLEVSAFIDRYVNQLKDRGFIRSEAVERAFRRVRRDQLLENFWIFDSTEWKLNPVTLDPITPDPTALALIYSDKALATRIGPHGGQTSSTSQPALVAIMLELLELLPGLRVLEIGAGTGYNAALMAEIVGDPALITTIDIQPDVIEQTSRLLAQAGYGGIRLLARDGFYGCPERAPFHRVVGTVCCTDLSPHWVEQLAAGGQMLIPLQHGGSNNAPLVRVWTDNGRVRGRVVDWSGFMDIQGEMNLPHPWAPVHWNSPLPEGRTAQRLPPLPEMPDSDWEKGKLTILDFHYFLALEDSRTCYVRNGLGLWDETRGLVYSLVEKDKDPMTMLYGDESLYREYLNIYERWQALGRPQARDFISEFEPTDTSSVTRSSVRKLDADRWMIERKYFRQVVRLRAQ